MKWRAREGWVRGRGEWRVGRSLQNKSGGPASCQPCHLWWREDTGLSHMKVSHQVLHRFVVTYFSALCNKEIAL